ncbi:MAG: alpha/beta hydrolase [Rhizobiaceae bacterium]|nr:alpha/beta hydrolase [Rhizobiaceae bacterium]
MSSSLSTQSKDGTSIAFDCSGSGPFLILIEPAGHYRNLSAFDGLVPLLTSDFTVIRFDRRGRGKSGDTRPYQTAREIEDLAALVEAAGGPVFAYGYSSGALLALHAAASGVPLAAMVLLEPPLRDEKHFGPDPLTGELNKLVTVGRNEEAVALFHAAIGVPQELIDGMRTTERWAMMVAVAPSLVHDCMLSDGMTPAICRAVEVPTLVLDSQGSSDDLTGSAASAAHLIPNARHKSLMGEWHVVEPELIAAEIRQFFGSAAKPA